MLFLFKVDDGEGMEEVEGVEEVERVEEVEGTTLMGPNKSARGTKNSLVGTGGTVFGDDNMVTRKNENISFCDHNIVTIILVTKNISITILFVTTTW